MTLRVGINGLARIGRQIVRSWITRHRNDFLAYETEELVSTTSSGA